MINTTMQDIRDLQNGIYNPMYPTPQLVKCIVCVHVFNTADPAKYCKCFLKYKLFIEND